MNVATMTMEPEQAKAKLAAYRKQIAKMIHVKARTDVAAQYQAAANGYKALSKGTPLLNIEDVIANAPQDEKLRPKLAIARADMKEVKFTTRWRTDLCEFDGDHRNGWSDRRAVGKRITVPMPANDSRKDGYALVPMIPADVQPDRCDLSKHFILWEVEQWADRSNLMRPDRDPYLLKHIGGPLYAVIAEWDLTDLERAVMQMSRPR